MGVEHEVVLSRIRLALQLDDRLHNQNRVQLLLAVLRHQHLLHVRHTHTAQHVRLRRADVNALVAQHSDAVLRAEVVLQPLHHAEPVDHSHVEESKRLRVLGWHRRNRQVRARVRRRKSVVVVLRAGGGSAGACGRPGPLPLHNVDEGLHPLVVLLRVAAAQDPVGVLRVARGAAEVDLEGHLRVLHLFHMLHDEHLLRRRVGVLRLLRIHMVQLVVAQTQRHRRPAPKGTAFFQYPVKRHPAVVLQSGGGGWCGVVCREGCSRATVACARCV